MRGRIGFLLVLVVTLAVARQAAAYPRPGRTIRASATEDVNGKPAGGGNVKISGDGRSVVYISVGPLLPGDSNGVSDCYVRDLVTDELTRASLPSTGGDSNAGCSSARLSEDGRFVAFVSSASNLVPGDTNGVADVFVRNLESGTTTRASVSATGAQADAASSAPSISSDGRVIGFLSSATNLVPGDANGANDIFVKNLETGAVQIASVDSDGGQGVTAIANWDLSGNGRYAVFVHRMPWDRDVSSFDDVFVHDLVTGHTELVSRATDGSQPNGNSFYPSISDDGRYVAFGSFGTNLVANDFNGAADAFVRDRQTGITERVSLTSDGGEVNNVVGVPIISGNGRFVTGNHLPTNYGYDDTNGNTDVYVFDRVTGAVELASATPEGTSTGNAYSLSPTISDDGRRVAFQSDATNLLDVPQPAGQVYVRDMGPTIGIGELSAIDGGNDVSVSGFARFAGQELLRIGDPSGDGLAAAGADLRGASAVLRPEEGDILLRLDLAPRTHAWAPLAGTTARKPGGLTYGITFDACVQVDPATAPVCGLHEIRATQTAQPTGTTFGLFRCSPACSRVAELTGGDATVGDAVVISVDTEMLGGDGATVDLRQVWVAAGEANTGPLEVLDEVGLSSVTLPATTVQLGSAPAGTPAADVAFGAAVDVSDGRFASSVIRGSGPREIWARACLGDQCSSTKVALA